MNDRTLWDVFAEEARDEALARVEAHADPEWKATALAVVEHLARTRDEMTTDDVWHVLDARGVTFTHEPRALGAVMKQAASFGWISRTERTRRSERVVRHAGDVRVWRCLLCTQ